MKFYKLFTLFIFSLFVFNIACDSGESSDTASSVSGATSAASGDTSVVALKQQVSRAVIDSASFSSLLGSALVKTITLACSDGGTYSVETGAYVYSDCNFGGVVLDGSIDSSVESSSISVIYTDFSIAISDFLMSWDGSFSFAESSGLLVITYDALAMTVSDGTNTFDASVDGSLSYDESDSTIDGDLTYGFDGTNYSCSFDSFAYETATDDEWVAACGL